MYAQQSGCVDKSFLRRFSVLTAAQMMQHLTEVASNTGRGTGKKRKISDATVEAMCDVAESACTAKELSLLTKTAQCARTAIRCDKLHAGTRANTLAGTAARPVAFRAPQGSIVIPSLSDFVMHHDGHKNSDTYLLRREHAKQLV
jgi:hypothetical protein